MEFDRPNSEQLDFDANLRKNGGDLHAWANEHIKIEESSVRLAKDFKRNISKVRQLAKRKSTRPTANAQLRDLISSSMPGLSAGYQGYIIYQLSKIAADIEDRALSIYCKAAAFRLMRNTPALRAYFADCAFEVCESISDRHNLTDKRLSRKTTWAIRAAREAQDNHSDFNWLPLAWHDVGICAFTNGHHSRAEDAFRNAIKLMLAHPWESGYFICDLYIKQAEVMRGLKKTDEEIAHFETAKSLLSDIQDVSLREMMQRRLKWALARSASNKNPQ